MKTRILIADDHQLVREGFRALLEKEADMEVVGEAGDGREGLLMTRERSPNVILMDISMPSLSGIEASSRILAEFPNMKIIILSIHSDRRYVRKALRVGVKGYMLKNAAVQELVEAIRTVVRGETYLSPRISGIVVEEYLMREETSESESSSASDLTPREREILQLLAEGLTTKEIASEINLGVKTVETHRQRIMDKLDLHNIVQLTKYAIREGLISLDA